MKSSTRFAIVFGATLVAIVAACASDSSPIAPNKNASATLTLADGAKLTIPAGALPEGTSITDIVVRPLDPSTVGDVHFAYDLQPEGLVFSQPLVLTRPNPFVTGAAYGVLLHSGQTGEALPVEFVNDAADGLDIAISIPHFSLLYSPQALVGPIRAVKALSPPPSAVAVGDTVSVTLRIDARLHGESPFIDWPGHFVTWDAKEVEYTASSYVKGPVTEGLSVSGTVGPDGQTVTLTMTCDAPGAFKWSVNVFGQIQRYTGEALLRDSAGQSLGATHLAGGMWLNFSGQCVAPSACCDQDGTCASALTAADCEGVFHEGKTCKEVDCSSCKNKPNAGCAQDADCDGGTCDTSSCACTKPVCVPQDPVLGNYATLGGLLRMQEELVCNALTHVLIQELLHSALGIPSRPVAGDWTTIWYYAAWRHVYAQTDVDPLFNFSDFECGDGPNGLTLCSALNNGAVPPGDFHGFAAVVKGTIPKADPTNSYQYAFVLDSDGVAGNNYVPAAAYPNDFFKGTDRWYEASYTPATGWTLKVTDAKSGSTTPMASDARMILHGDALYLLIPSGELEVDNPRFRVTAFRHSGDYGINPPHDYDGSVWPAVADGLAAFP